MISIGGRTVAGVALGEDVQPPRRSKPRWIVLPIIAGAILAGLFLLHEPERATT